MKEKSEFVAVLCEVKEDEVTLRKYIALRNKNEKYTPGDGNTFITIENLRELLPVLSKYV